MEPDFIPPNVQECSREKHGVQACHLPKRIVCRPSGGKNEKRQQAQQVHRGYYPVRISFQRGQVEDWDEHQVPQELVAECPCRAVPGVFVGQMGGAVKKRILQEE